MNGPGAASVRPAETAVDLSAPPPPSRGDDAPPTRSPARATTGASLTRHPHGREALAGLLSVPDGAGVPANRASPPGHVTCSAVVAGRGAARRPTTPYGPPVRSVTTARFH